MEDKGLLAAEPADEPIAPPQVITLPAQRPPTSHVLQLVTLAQQVDLLHTPGGEAYATVPVHDH